MKEEQIWDIISKHLSGECNKEEETEFREWLDKNSENKTTFLELMKIWEDSAKVKPDFEPDTESALIKVLTNINESDNKKNNIRRLTTYSRRIAAVLLLGVVITYAYFQLSENNPAQFAQEFLSTSDKNEMVLEDGTRIFLNSNSKIKYPKKFKKNKREIYLDGEAYFEVSKDADKPFIIHTQTTTTEVLGTSFNLKAYKNDKSVSIIVKEGKVSFSSEKSNNKVILIKDDLGLINKKDGIVLKKKNDDINYLSWKTGILYFEKSPLKEVIKVLSNHYQKDFEIKDKELEEKKLTATYNNKSIKELLEIIKHTFEIDYRIEDKKIVLFVE